eukprot:4220906-Amphidinium_carterae.1
MQCMFIDTPRGETAIVKLVNAMTFVFADTPWGGGKLSTAKSTLMETHTTGWRRRNASSSLCHLVPY